MEKEKVNNSRDLYIGIGSNLSNPILQLNKAIKFLSQLDKLNDIKSSSFYESPPMGPSDQNNYLNTAVMFKSSESPEDILKLLKDISICLRRRCFRSKNR